MKIKYVIFLLLISFLFINNVNAKRISCNYINGTITFTCSVSNNSINCSTASKVDGTKASSLKSTDFKKDGEIVCSNVPSIYIDGFMHNGTLYYYDIKTTNSACDLSKTEYEKYKQPGTNNIGDCIPFSLNGSTSVENPLGEEETGDWEKDPEYIKAEEDVKEFCNTDELSSYSIKKCEEATAKQEEIKNKYLNTAPSTSDDPDNSVDDQEFKTETFCQRSAVSGTFRMIGWVFFTLKILIPIILIIFGAIDFGKAIIANKNDEIKKSAKSLAIRAITGIIIFFIPTILNFVIGIIGGNEIYEKDAGTFGFCTHCMFEPNDSECGSLMGGR